MRCDFAVCEHDHTSGSSTSSRPHEEKKPGKGFIFGLILFFVVWFGFMVYGGNQLDKSLVEQEREVHQRSVHNTAPAGNGAPAR